MRLFLRPLLALLVSVVPMPGHEFPGHPTPSRTVHPRFGSDLYLGRDGYRHGGIGITMALDGHSALTIGAHVVRETSAARDVPSFELEWIGDLPGGVELEIFGFAYSEVEQKHAWGLGVRVAKPIRLTDRLSIEPFAGPTFASVRAERGETSEPVTVAHTLLLAGATMQAGPLTATLLGSHSIYDHDIAGLETPVDLESVTHFAAYENNDGFARTTGAVEIGWAVYDWLSLHARYAVMHFDEGTRHAIAVTPTVKLGEHVELTAGGQWLRGGEVENDLTFIGLSVSF